MKRAIIYITLLCLCSNMQAQHKVLNLQQCLNMAYEKNYKILAANKSIERAKNLQATAWDIDKTDLTLSQYGQFHFPHSKYRISNSLYCKEQAIKSGNSS